MEGGSSCKVANGTAKINRNGAEEVKRWAICKARRWGKVRQGTVTKRKRQLGHRGQRARREQATRTGITTE